MSTSVEQEHEALIQFLYQSPVGLVQATAEGEITMINPMGAQLLMPLAPQGLLINLFDVLATLTPQLRELVLSSGGSTGVICDSLRLRLPPPAGKAGDRKRAPSTLDLRLVRLGPDKLMASVSDVSLVDKEEQQRLAERLRDASRVDALTALPNRTVALERIESALATARQPQGPTFAVLFINGDRFNRINVTMGQAGGDELLRQMAARLMGMVRLGDAVASSGDGKRTPVRLSGDEFVVVMEDLRHPGEARTLAARMAARLVEVLSKPYRIGNEQVYTSVSVGVALGHHEQPHGDAVLQEASLAMREAKLAGGARFQVFSADMKERAWWRGVVEDDLRQAVVAEQLFVVYQPIVHLGSQRAAGVEALVRWNHPVRGLVSPVDFIPIAEESGLIGPLSAFVLRTACAQFAQWRAQLGALAPGLMSVNLSRAQLSDPTLLDQVADALRDTGMPAACLQLEVTESLAAQDESVQSRLRELKALGLTLALDDFGTGYSSLASLHQLPVDVVKIDRSFVSQLESSEYHRVLVQATVRVARTLGMGTVAEGVETRGQAQLLTALQCDKGQGYLFGRPLSSEQATQWLIQRPQAPAASVAASPTPATPVEGTGSGTPATATTTRLLELLDRSQLAVAVFDPDERLAYANRSYRSLYWDRPEETPTWEEVMREAYRSRKGLLIDTSDIDTWLADVRKRYRQQALRRFESDITDGRWLRVTEETRPDGWQLCVSTDVTSLKSTEADLRRARDAALMASVTDPLTELPNRRFVFGRLETLLAQAQASGRPLSVVLIDLDEFKSINDEHGHAVGDQVLVGFSQRLAQSVRQRDAVGRIGGEEFLLVLTDTGHEGALRVLSELRAMFSSLARPHLPPDVAIGFSAGIAQAHTSDTADSLWQRADQGVYLAKAGGRGQDVFVPHVAP